MTGIDSFIWNYTLWDEDICWNLLCNPGISAMILKKSCRRGWRYFLCPDGNFKSYTLKRLINSYEPPIAANLAAT